MQHARLCPFTPALYVVGGTALLMGAIGTLLAALLHMCAVIGVLLVHAIRELDNPTYALDAATWDNARRDYTEQCPDPECDCDVWAPGRGVQ